MTPEEVRKMILDILNSNQYNVSKIPYHIHNNIDAPSIFLPYTILAGQGNPSLQAKEGTLYIKTNASSTTDRLWVNTTGGTVWAYFTSST